jgi:hypothetical protein
MMGVQFRQQFFGFVRGQKAQTGVVDLRQLPGAATFGG